MAHLSFDNHFNGDPIIQHVGENGRKGTWTTPRDCLPKGIPKQYLHAKKGVLINSRSGLLGAGANVKGESLMAPCLIPVVVAIDFFHFERPK